MDLHNFYLLANNLHLFWWFALINKSVRGSGLARVWVLEEVAGEAALRSLGRVLVNGLCLGIFQDYMNSSSS
jgi:hypothetical protein